MTNSFHLAVVAALVVLGALGVYLSWNPERAVLAWAATIGIQLDLYQFQLGVSDVLAVTLAFWTIVLASRRPPKPTGIMVWLLTFVGMFITWANLVAVLNLGDLPKWTYLNKDVGLIEMLFCIAAIVLTVDSRARLNRLLVAFVGGGSLLNFVGLVLLALLVVSGVGKFVVYGGFRYTGFMPNPNAWACYLAVIAQFQFCFLVFGQTHLLRVPVMAQWVNFALLTIGVLASLSRAGMIQLPLGLCCTLLFLEWRKRIATGWAMLIVGGLLSIPLWQSGAFSIVASRALGGDLSSRLIINRAAWDMYTNSPLSVLFGVGIGGFIQTSASRIGVVYEIHNTFFWLLVEGGPLLLIIFLVTMSCAISRAIGAAKAHVLKPFGVAVCSSLVVTFIFFLANEGIYQRQFWLLLALAEIFVAIPRKMLTFVISPGQLEPIA